jgi:ABC-type multidrug transport system ATPase subunit
MNAIEMKGLTKFYGRSRGILGLDLTVSEGEFFGFIGPNGAGKSTTIRTLLGLIKGSKGSASIFGKDIVKEKTSILSQVGYMPSEAVFYPGMRVKEVKSQLWTRGRSVVPASGAGRFQKSRRTVIWQPEKSVHCMCPAA